MSFMKLLSVVNDQRIDGKNFLFEMSIADYIKLADKMAEKNEFQRLRVKSSKTVYSLLKEDLKKGCVIPPIVLASMSMIDFNPVAGSEITESEINGESLLILDGLQRTYTLRDVIDELTTTHSNAELKKFLETPLRVEIYTGISRMGILYRMLTLNTGQTPMSLRHQIEILYSDYLTTPIDNISIHKDIDEERSLNVSEYNFRDVVEGFNSYIDRSELPIDRIELLKNIESLKELAKEEVSKNKDPFSDFVKVFDEFIKKINTEVPNWEFDKEELKKLNLSSDLRPFGRTIPEIFSKSQVLTGFGSAIGKLKDYKKINDFGELNKIINEINNVDNTQIYLLLNCLNEVAKNSKKIGNSQRLFFHYFFRELLNSESDSFTKFDNAIENGYKKYLSQTV